MGVECKIEVGHPDNEVFAFGDLEMIRDLCNKLLHRDHTMHSDLADLKRVLVVDCDHVRHDNFVRL